MSRQQSGLACQECRRRKARCDRVRPKCGICQAAGRTGVIADERTARGQKKGQLKEVRSRLAIIEEQLNRQNQINDGTGSPDSASTSQDGLRPEDIDSEDATIAGEIPELEFINFPPQDDISLPYCPENVEWTIPYGSGDDPWTNMDHLSLCNPQAPLMLDIPPSIPEPFIGELDLSELARTDLDLLYFERVHPVAPMIHKRRYFAWEEQENVTPAQACLRYAMRAVAAASSTQFYMQADSLYTHTKRLLEMQDVCQQSGLPWVTSTLGPHRQVPIELIQAWLLLAHYELLRKSHEDALLTANRAFRLLQVTRAFDLDVHDVMAAPSTKSSIHGSLPPSPPYSIIDTEESWIEVEAKRRTLWAAFILDRLCGIVNDRPTMLDEEMINTRLPMPESDFQTGDRPIQMAFLPESMANGNDDETMSSFARCVTLANLLGRCRAHRRLSQTNLLPDSSSEAKMRDFWARHEWLAAAADTARTAKSWTQPQKPEEPPKCDPMKFFNKFLAQCACILLSETAESWAWPTESDQLMAMAYKQVADQAVNEISTLIRTTPRIAFFKIHPVFPNILYLTARFLCKSSPQLMGMGHPTSDNLSPLCTLLRRLSEVNNLAREWMVKAEIELRHDFSIAIA